MYIMNLESTLIIKNTKKTKLYNNVDIVKLIDDMFKVF